jgi:hypothetical protein
MLLRHHAVDGVHRHAHEQRDREEEERPGRSRHQREPSPMRGTQQKRTERDVIGAELRAHQRVRKWAERAEQL